MAKAWALVTGASGGLGEQLALNLAGRGYNLILVARGEAEMHRVGAEIRDRHDAEVKVEALDLSANGSAGQLCERLAQLGIEPDILINNAAFGMTGPFVESDPSRLYEMLQLDIVCLTELTLLLGRAMVARRRGKILMIASLAAFQPAPDMAAYAAAKAFVLSLGEALHVELAPTVTVTVLSPGLMETGFNAASGFETPANLRRTILPTAKVAEIGLDAMFAGKPSVVAGRINRIMALSSRLFSRHFAAKTVYQIGQKAAQRTDD